MVGPFPGGVFLEEVGKAGDGIRVVGDEFVIETHNTKEGTKVGQIARRLDIADSLDLIGRHPDSFATYHGEPKEVALFGEPMAFMGLEAEAVLGEGLEDFGDVGFVLLEGSLSVDDHVVEVRVAEKTEERVED